MLAAEPRPEPPLAAVQLAGRRLAGCLALAHNRVAPGTFGCNRRASDAPGSTGPARRRARTRTPRQDTVHARWFRATATFEATAVRTGTVQAADRCDAGTGCGEHEPRRRSARARARESRGRAASAGPLARRAPTTRSERSRAAVTPSGEGAARHSRGRGSACGTALAPGRRDPSVGGGKALVHVARESGGHGVNARPRGRWARLRVRHVRPRGAEREKWEREARSEMPRYGRPCLCLHREARAPLRFRDSTTFERAVARAATARRRARRDVRGVTGGEEREQRRRTCKGVWRTGVTAWPLARLDPTTCSERTPARRRRRAGEEGAACDASTVLHGRRRLRWHRSLSAALLPCQHHFRSRAHT